MTVVAIVLQTNSLVRRSCYEFFLHLHIALIILLIAALRTHLHGMPHQKYLTVVIASWAATVSHSSPIYLFFLNLTGYSASSVYAVCFIAMLGEEGLKQFARDYQGTQFE